MSDSSHRGRTAAAFLLLLSACASDGVPPGATLSDQSLEESVDPSAIDSGTTDSSGSGRPISLRFLGRFRQPGGDVAGTAEIVSYDPATRRLFVVNPTDGTVDVLDISAPSRPVRVARIDTKPYGAAANSVAVRNGVVAVAIEATDKQARGKAVFFDVNGRFRAAVEVGALPDMITWSPDGAWVLVANEGEPNAAYTVDPEGSVSVIDLRYGVQSLAQRNVRHATFSHLTPGQLDPSVRVYGPSASVAQDFEPEYITVSADSRFAYVTLQENNAIAVVSIRDARVVDVMGLGFKDHSLSGNELDTSDRDGAIAINKHPVRGMYMPDAIASMPYNGRTLLFTASEGDTRDYDGFSEEARVGDLTLDPAAFPNAEELQAATNMGRLKVTNTKGDSDGDGDYDALYSFGTRSFSIWTDDGRLVYDSGSALERITAARLPDAFNADNEENDSFDGRSDDKGPEPEAIVIGKVGARTYAFVGLERIGGFVVYDVTRPTSPQFVQYVNGRNFAADTADALDLGPEGVLFISDRDSPTGKPLLVAAHEVSGSTTIYEIR
jgi:2',3'-cyclic-nucleotide 2'-phosphodiesterase/3'-nucleotidase/5'-nucleotidase